MSRGTKAGYGASSERSGELDAAFEATKRFWLEKGSEYSSESLRRRGFHRDFGEILLEANHLLAEMLAEVPERARAEARSELTPEEVEVLERGDVDLSPWRPEEEDPQVDSLLKYTNMLAAGLSTEEAAEALGVSEGRVRQRINAERTLFGVKTPRGWRLPAFQFEEGGEIPNIGRVFGVLDPGLHPLSVANWFLLPKPELYFEGDEERLYSPREWLLSGGNPEVLLPLAGDL